MEPSAEELVDVLVSHTSSTSIGERKVCLFFILDVVLLSHVQPDRLQIESNLEKMCFVR